MTPETRTLWTRFFADHASVLLYTADPGAHALGLELSVLLNDRSRLQGWYAEGWSMSRRPQCQPVDTLPSNLVPGTTLLLGSQTQYPRTHHFLQMAREHGARSIFVFDHWKNYAEHFKPGLVADQVVVPDETGREALLAAIGAQYAARVSVLPHLGIDAAVARIRAHSLRLPDTIAVLLDPTEPADGLGYDWRSVLQEVALHAKARPQRSYLVKPHPRQQPALVQDCISALGLPAARMRVVDMDTEQLIAAADEVWGMTTIALISALLAGKPIRTIQSGRNERGRAASNHYLEPHLI